MSPTPYTDLMARGTHGPAPERPPRRRARQPLPWPFTGRTPKPKHSPRSVLRMMRYARPHWRPLLVVLLTMGLTSAVELAKPWPIKLLVDNVLGDNGVPGSLDGVVGALPGPGGKEGLLLFVVAGTLLIFVVGTLVQMVNTYASTGLGQRMTFDLGAEMFLRLQRLSLLFHSRRMVGDTIARVTGDAYAPQVLVQSALIPVVQSLITIVAMFVIMWKLQSTLALLSLAVVPLLVIVIRVFAQPMKQRSRVTRDLEGQMMGVVQQTLTAVPAVQAFTREELEHDRYRGYADKAVTAYLRSAFAAMWFRLFAGLVTAAGSAAILYVGARLALDGKVTTGTIIVFISYVASLYSPLDAISYTASTVQQAAAQGDRVCEILDAPIEITDSPSARDMALGGPIRYEQVTFGYEPGRPALEDISLEVRPGEALAIVGPTGAGKTTLVNLLVRFFDPWEGRVTIKGVDVRDIRLRSLRQQVALVLQEPFIFPLTVAENIGYGRPGATGEEIVEAARAANAHEFIERLPDGYDAMVGERGTTLSGGEKQRLSIARAFLKDAPVLVLDEPTSALDARTESLLLEALERLMEGRITFTIAHRLSTIRNANQIIVIQRGRIVEGGGHEELLERGGLYASLYRHQMQVARHGDNGSPAAAHSGVTNGAGP